MMNHRHLLPNEIDLLVDGEAGFGVAPLRAHLTECDDCRARHDELRTVSDAIDSLPHFSPALRFSDSVMAKVQVIEPWYLALADTVSRLIPSSTPMRVLAGAGASVAAFAISGSAVYLAFRADLAAWMFDLFLDRTRHGIAVGATEIAANALGADATAAIASGGPSLIAITVGSLAIATLGAIFGFRRLASTARANRS